MAVDDTFPPRNLPDGAVEWGRTMEDEVRSAQKDLLALSQYTSGQNRSTAASLSDIARQLTAISEQQSALAQQQAQIVAAQDGINATQTFLLNQTQYAGNPASQSATSVSPSPGLSLFAYDPTYDIELSVTTSSTGRLSISVGAYVMALDAGAGVGVEIVGVTTPDYFNSVACFGLAISASRSFVTALSPNSAYTIRTRRWWTSGTTGGVGYSNQNLSVTKIGQ